MGTRYVPEHKPSYKSGPRGANATSTEIAQEVVEVVKAVETHKEVAKSPEKPVVETVTSVEETVVAPVVEEKPVAVETKVAPAVDAQKDTRKKRP